MIITKIGEVIISDKGIEVNGFAFAAEDSDAHLLMEGANPEQLVLDCATKWAMQKMQVSLNKEILKAVAEQKVREGKPN
jgi:hypothetical protein